MNKLRHLITNVRRENKVSVDEVIDMLCCALEDCERSEYIYVYKEIYEKAYGSSLTREIADEWVKSMDVTDGSGREHGMKYTLEKCIEMGNSLGIDWSKMGKIDWFVAVNMAYSDMYHTAKTYNLEEDPMFFARAAKDTWVNDKDVRDKTLVSYYFKYVI